MLKQQDFEHRIEGYQEQVYLYEDELLQSIILSLIPSEVQSTAGQVAQLKALMKWFKTEFFSWCDKPKCTKCGQNDAVQGLGAEKSNSLERTEGNALSTEKY